MELQVYDLRCDKQQDFYIKMVTKVASSCRDTAFQENKQLVTFQQHTFGTFHIWKVHDASITLHHGYI